MLTTFIFTIAYNAIAWIISWFPVSSGYPQVVFDAVDTISGYMGLIDKIIPLETLAYCLAIIFSVELLIWGFKTVKWIISHIPFVGGRG